MTLSGFSEIERASIEEVRWWTLPDLAASTEVFYPADLVPLVRDLVTALLAPTGVSFDLRLHALKRDHHVQLAGGFLA